MSSASNGGAPQANGVSLADSGDHSVARVKGGKAKPIRSAADVARRAIVQDGATGWSDVVSAVLATSVHGGRFVTRQVVERPIMTFAAGALLGWIVGRTPVSRHRSRRKYARWR